MDATAQPLQQRALQLCSPDLFPWANPADFWASKQTTQRSCIAFSGILCLLWDDDWPTSIPEEHRSQKTFKSLKTAGLWLCSHIGFVSDRIWYIMLVWCSRRRWSSTAWSKHGRSEPDNQKHRLTVTADAFSLRCSGCLCRTLLVISWPAPDHRQTNALSF